jgi:hypothetical protein
MYTNIANLMLRRVAMGGGVAALASSRDEGLIHYRVRVNTFERRCKFGNKSDNLLDMRGPENRSIGISSFFTRNTIDTFKFSDVTLTAKQIKQRVQ